MALQKSTYSETDIIKAVCLKKQFQVAYSSLQTHGKDQPKADWVINDLSSKDNRDARKDQVKLALKVWFATTKFVKSQCNKQRIIDTIFYGTFAKAVTLGHSDADYFVYCPGPKAVFKLQENIQNIPDIP